MYGICRIATDISEQKRDEAEKLELERKFFTAQRLESIGRLAGGIAHDFNNILNSIYGFTEYSLMELKEGKVDAEVLQENIALISGAAERAAELTQKLLAFSRKQTTKPRAINLNQYIASMQSLLSRLVGDNYQIEIDADTSLAEVIADPSQLEQVILNLVVNARDAMPEGGAIQFTTCNITPSDKFFASHSEIMPSNMVELCISDNGCGIQPEAKDRIFEPFFTTKVHQKGSGLGLSMAYGVIKQHNGYIYCDSMPGKGTSFKVLLPAYV